MPLLQEKYIKNIEHDTVLVLKDWVEVLSGQVVSKTLVQNDALGITFVCL